MQTGYASPGADGGNRCRDCAVQDRPHRWGREGGFEEAAKYNITALPHVKVYNRGGSLVGSVLGVDIGKIKSYVAQAEEFLITYFTLRAGG